MGPGLGCMPPISRSKTMRERDRIKIGEDRKPAREERCSLVDQRRRSEEKDEQRVGIEGILWVFWLPFEPELTWKSGLAWTHNPLIVDQCATQKCGSIGSWWWWWRPRRWWCPNFKDNSRSRPMLNQLPRSLHDWLQG